LAALTNAVTAPPEETLAVAGPGAPGGLLPGGNTTAHLIDVAQVQGQVHAQSVQKVGELADRNPTEAVSIIRSWLHENA
jgi:flagellar M-ring protein FliF